MRTRTISALVGVALLALAALLYPTWLFNVLIGVVGVIAVLELFSAFDAMKHRDFLAIALLFTVLSPFATQSIVKDFLPLILALLFLLFAALVIKNHSSIAIEKMITLFSMSILVPILFSCAIYMRDRVGWQFGVYYLFLALGSAWFADTGAYFSGYFFGKRKMAPLISPKKTVEGAVGGILVATCCNLLLALLYKTIYTAVLTPISVNFWAIALVSPLLAGVGILGDLLASVIKRQHNVKDYGHIMPGHGGVMDRFDSAILTIPSVFLMSFFLKIIS